MTPEARRYFIRIMAGVVILAGSFGLYRAMLRMNADSLYHLNLFAQFLLILMGVILAVRPKWPEKRPIIVLGSFLLVGGLSMFAAVRQGQENARQNAETQRRADEAKAKHDATLERINSQSIQIGNQTDEIKRVQDLNTELQTTLLDQSGELIDSSKRITRLSKEAIDVATGAGFCYAHLSEQFTPRGVMTFVFIRGDQNKRAPLFEVRARVIDLQVMDDLLAKKDPEWSQKSEFSFVVGNLISQSALMTQQTIRVADAPRHDYRIFFTARHGWWSQDIQLVKLGNAYSQATRVTASVGNKERVVYTSIPKDFPGGKNAKWHN